MACLTPLTIRANEMKAVKEFTHVVPCGKCPACLSTRQSGWIFRIEQEMKRSTSAGFYTFTYDEKNVKLSSQGYQTLDKKDWQDFMKRIRHENIGKLKYFVSGEYGDSSFRPHYHAILFNLDRDMAQSSELLQYHWKNGYVDIGQLNAATIAYCTKYMLKGVWKPEDESDDREKQFQLQSKGLGENFITENMKMFMKEDPKPYLIREDGKKLKLPRYYKDKIHTVGEKARINQVAQEGIKEFPNEKHRIDYIYSKIENAKKKLTPKRNKL